MRLITIQTPNRSWKVLDASHATRVVLSYCRLDICDGRKGIGDKRRRWEVRVFEP